MANNNRPRNRKAARDARARQRLTGENYTSARRASSNRTLPRDPAATAALKEYLKDLPGAELPITATYDGDPLPWPWNDPGLLNPTVAWVDSDPQFADHDLVEVYDGGDRLVKITLDDVTLTVDADVDQLMANQLMANQLIQANATTTMVSVRLEMAPCRLELDISLDASGEAAEIQDANLTMMEPAPGSPPSCSPTYG